MKFMRTVSLAVIMSFISVVPPIYADTNAVQTANAQKNSSYRFPRINAEMAKQLMSDTLVDRLGFGDYAPVDPLVKNMPRTRIWHHCWLVYFQSLMDISLISINASMKQKLPQNPVTGRATMLRSTD